jgi:predicted dinucleotide-binding enzyme
MTSVTIFGKGKMGTAIDGILASGGASVNHIDTSGTGEVTGDIVILAVPYSALEGIVTSYGDALAGKVVVDLTNPVDFATFDGLTVDSDGSAAAELAAALPNSHVLKAFNTNFAATLASKSVGAHPTTVLIAGDDADSKKLLADAITAGGVRAEDVGSLKRARELEALGFLQITLAASEKVGWDGGFGVHK